MKVRLYSFLLICILFFSFREKEHKDLVMGSMRIELSNIRNHKGHIYVFIYAYENQYPYNPYKHYKIKKDKVKNGNIAVTISDLQIDGKFAITLIDDENNNQDLDRWLGIPKEGYGFSNNVKPFLSLPDYDDLLCEFEKSHKLNIKLQYVL